MEMTKELENLNKQLAEVTNLLIKIQTKIANITRKSKLKQKKHEQNDIKERGSGAAEMYRTNSE